MSLKSKFLNVMKQCAYVQKQGENTFYRYKYATAADVLEKVNAALVQEGIISVAKPVILSTEQVTTAKGSIETRVTVEMNVTLTDSVTGETMTLTGYGSGQDTGDKAVMKAQTAALKYTYMMSLNISTGDDPEADTGVDVRTNTMAVPVEAPAVSKPEGRTIEDKPLVTPEQLKIIFVLARRAGIADDTMKERIHAAYKVSSSKELTKVQAAELIDKLKSEADAVKEAG